MGGEIGSLAPGRRADVVIWSGDPLENASVAEAVWIDGVRQPLDNHQTQAARPLPRPRSGATCPRPIGGELSASAAFFA